MDASRRLGTWSALLLVSSAFSSAFAEIRYVDASRTTGADDGSTWANAFQDSGGLRKALLAAVPGDQIWVARGTYFPTRTKDRSRSFEMVDGVSMYGGFVGTEVSLGARDPIANETILSGDLEGDDGIGSYSDNSYNVVRSAQALLDGFTVTSGNADGNGGSGGGGGILIEDSFNEPVVRRCVIRRNRAQSGGGVRVRSTTQIPVFEDCRFEFNLAETRGGAVDLIDTADVDFDRCVFRGNLAAQGSAVYLQFAYSGHFRECVFYEHTTPGAATIHVVTDSNIDIVGCTVARNSGVGLRDESSGSTTVVGSIFYFASSISAAPFVSVDPTYSCIQGGHPGTGNIGSDPQFVDALGGNFRLGPASPCVDAGAGIFTSYDLDWTPRREDVFTTPDTGPHGAPVVDMGAYESPGGPSVPTCAGDGSLATSCPCANAGYAGHGCRASSATYFSGGYLTSSGNTNPDTVVLSATTMLPSVTCIFLQGNASIASGLNFGDGVRCVGGALKRLGVKSASALAAASYPGVGDLSITARSAALGDPIASGSMRWYQVWYRDSSATFCPAPQGGTSNVTSGVVVSW